MLQKYNPSKYFKGVLLCLVIAAIASFVSSTLGGPQLLYALLFGLAFHFLSAYPRIKIGLDFCSRSLLRAGVALLGVRITLAQISGLGWQNALLVTLALVLTIASGVLLAKLLGQTRDQGLISGSSVAICGASAALAVASVLPQTKENERFTLLTVVGVTVLSTVAMIVYPFGLKALAVNPQTAGVFLGGTIHDVAQVVAAGMMLGQQAGDTATVVKLWRVLLLMPVSVVIALFYRRAVIANPDTDTPTATVPLMPTFLLAFIVLVLMSSASVFNGAVIQLASQTSRWFLVIAIAAAGVKTSFADLMELGWQPVVMLVVESLVVCAVIALGLLAQ